MKKTLTLAALAAVLMSLVACGANPVTDKTVACDAARLAQGEPYNNNDMGNPHCPYVKK